MGTINQSPFGSIKGAFGNLIGAIWKGRGYIKVRPASVSNPKTPKQVRQRSRMSACVKLAKLIKSNIIKPIWNKKAGDISGFNFFVQKNVLLFATDGTIADYENFIFSVGDLPLPKNIVVENDVAGNGAIIITWTDNSGEDIAAATDLLCLLTTNGKEPVVMKALAFARDAGQAAIQLPYGAGETVHVYVFFQEVEESAFSNSFHALVNIPTEPTP
jgi:hypothetical protein